MTDPGTVERGNLEAVVKRAIVTVAPDADPESLDPKEDLWYALDLDSMDQLNIMVAIEAATGITIPEVDYPRLETVEDMIDYLGRQRSQADRPSA